MSSSSTLTKSVKPKSTSTSKKSPTTTSLPHQWTATIPTPSTTGLCGDTFHAFATVSVGISIPAKVPSVVIEVPGADQSGEFSLELNGPANAANDVIAWQVLVSGNPAPVNSQDGGHTLITWTAPSANPSGTTVEILMKADLGIEIFAAILTIDVSSFKSMPSEHKLIGS